MTHIVTYDRTDIETLIADDLIKRGLALKSTKMVWLRAGTITTEDIQVQASVHDRCRSEDKA